MAFSLVVSTTDPISEGFSVSVGCSLLAARIRLEPVAADVAERHRTNRSPEPVARSNGLGTVSRLPLPCVAVVR